MYAGVVFDHKRILPFLATHLLNLRHMLWPADALVMPGCNVGIYNDAGRYIGYITIQLFPSLYRVYSHSRVCQITTRCSQWHVVLAWGLEMVGALLSREPGDRKKNRFCISELTWESVLAQLVWYIYIYIIKVAKFNPRRFQCLDLSKDLLRELPLRV